MLARSTVLAAITIDSQTLSQFIRGFKLHLKTFHQICRLIVGESSIIVSCWRCSDLCCGYGNYPFIRLYILPRFLCLNWYHCEPNFYTQHWVLSYLTAVMHWLHVCSDSMLQDFIGLVAQIWGTDSLPAELIATGFSWIAGDTFIRQRVSCRVLPRRN